MLLVCEEGCDRTKEVSTELDCKVCKQKCHYNYVELLVVVGKNAFRASIAAQGPTALLQTHCTTWCCTPSTALYNKTS